MATQGDVRVGDVGTHYQAKIEDVSMPFDPTLVTEAKLLWKPPQAASFERVATITRQGNDAFLNYSLVAGPDDDFHSKAGLWSWQGYVLLADGQRYHTSIETYLVGANLDG